MYSRDARGGYRIFLNKGGEGGGGGGGLLHKKNQYFGQKSQ